MKLKKLLAIATAAAMSLTVAAALVACGPENPDDGDKKPDAATITYQFTGASDELANYGWAYYVYLNLWSDGTVSGSGYNYLSVENALKEKWFRGSWEEKEDEDAGKIVQLKAIWDSDATNDMSGGTSTAGRIENYTLYFDEDGTTLTDFTLKIPLMSERDATMTCHVPALYQTQDEFIAGAKEYGAAHQPGGGGDDDEKDYGNAIATLTTTEDEYTAVFYDSGVVVIDANYAKPVLGWKYENGTFTFTETEGNKQGQTTTDATLTVDGTTGTLEYSLYGTVTFTYTGDVSALIGEETAPTVLATLTGENGITATFYSDGTVKVTTTISQLSPTWNWKYENDDITFTEEGKDTAPSGVTFAINDTTGTLTYAPTFLQGQSLSYTGDVSALIK